MTATTQRDPYIWVTWITKLLAGDDQCQWASWFKAHFRYSKREERRFDNAAWAANHAQMVRDRAEYLTKHGWLIWIEDQNKFSIKGRLATLGGKPDIVALKENEVLVVDCKSGKPRKSDWWQVLCYMFTLPQYHPAVTTGDRRVVGEVQYPMHSITIQPEELTPAIREQIIQQIRLSGGEAPAQRVPSTRECGFCDIGDDCPYRVSTDTSEVTSDLF